jgi:hypothetical protein
LTSDSSSRKYDQFQIHFSKNKIKIGGFAKLDLKLLSVILALNHFANLPFCQLAISSNY